MIADSSFRMGTSHETSGTPCQDYALAESDVKWPFAVISDGCSSSGETDIGARLYSRAARSILMPTTEQFLSNFSADSQFMLFRYDLIKSAYRSMRAIELNEIDMDATFGMVQAIPDGRVRSYLFGDGVLAAKTQLGLEAIVVEWVGNMPGYLSYEFPGSEERRAAFVRQSEEFSQQQGIASWRAERFLIAPDFTVQSLWVEERNASDGLKGISVEWPDGTDIAIVTSDGVSQFHRLGWSEVISELSALKAAREGSFMKRRMARALSGFAKRGFLPVDDVSVAALAARLI